jgi:UDP-N-acetylmuramate dehydrogenase
MRFGSYAVTLDDRMTPRLPKSRRDVAFRENLPLAPFTTLKIGGPARYFTEAETEEEILDALAFARQKDLPVFVLGGGSNVLISDAGFPGLVLHVCPRGIETSNAGGPTVLVKAAAGEEWDGLVDHVVNAGFAGIENLSGIPGLVGGTPVQNVGAYGQEVSETIISVRCIDRRSLEVVEFDNTDCLFSYRSSIFNTTDRNRYIVMEVTFRLTPGGEPKLSYKDLREHFRDRRPDLRTVREAVLGIRRRKSMVIDTLYPNAMSVGSFFKNPVVSADRYVQIRQLFDDMPSFPFGDGVKIPAAWLIENAGFYKGFSRGKVGISSNHALALINRGGATAADIIELKSLIQERVHTTFGIELVPEPVLVGF